MRAGRTERSWQWTRNGFEDEVEFRAKGRLRWELAHCHHGLDSHHGRVTGRAILPCTVDPKTEVRKGEFSASDFAFYLCLGG